MPVSSLDEATGVYNGYPAVVGRQGILRRLDLRLTEQEGIKFQQSVNILKQTLRQVEDC